MILSFRNGVLAFACCALAAVSLLSSDANAQRRDRARDKDSGAVTACSRYGNGCVSGPTRQGRVEREVRMPGGTWIGCKLDCRNTLREETVDFFDTIRERAPGNFR